MPLSGKVVIQRGIVYQVNTDRVGVVGYEDSYLFSNPVKIEEHIDGKPVEYIGEGAFANCNSNIEKIILPNSCSSIKTRAFQNCKTLKDVSFAKNSPSCERVFVGVEAFSGCNSLDIFSAGESHLWLMENSFTNCFGLRLVIGNIYITKGIVFANCNNLSLVSVADGALLSAKTFHKATTKQLIVFGHLRRPSKELFKKLNKTIIVCTKEFPYMELAYEGYSIKLM